MDPVCLYGMLETHSVNIWEMEEWVEQIQDSSERNRASMDEGFSNLKYLLQFIISIHSSALFNDSVITDIMSIMIDIIIFFVERIVK